MIKSFQLSPGLATRDVRTRHLDKLPLLLQQVLLIRGDQKGGVCLDHHHKTLQILQIHVQSFSQTGVKVFHLFFKGLKEGFVLIKIMNGSSDSGYIFLPVVDSNSKEI